MEKVGLLVQELLARYEVVILGTLGLIAGGALLCSLFLCFKLSSLSRRYQILARLARDPQAVANLEKTLAGLERLQLRVDALSGEQERLGLLLRRCTRTPALKRFNAFDDVGSNLSFSLALLDGEGNGVILTSLYGRQESRTYAKKIEGGTAQTRLSAEEEEILNTARSRI